jgi:PAS domain S-box-containing protein
MRRVIPADRQGEEDMILARLAVGERIENYETKRVTKDGRTFDASVTISPLRNAAGHIIGASKIIRDITERKRTEEALRGSEALLRTVTDTASVGLAVLDLERRYTFTNPAYSTILELADELVGSSPATVLAPVYADQISPRLDRAFAGERVSYEMTRADRVGLAHHYVVVYEPQWDASRKVDGVVVVIYEITERKQAESALRDRIRQLDTLAQTSQRLLLSEDGENDLLKTVFSDIAELLGAEMFYHYRPGTEPGLLVLELCAGVDPDERSAIATLRVGELLCGRVAQARTRLIIEDLQHGNYPGSEPLAKAGATSYAGFPLVANGDLVGTIAFASRHRTHFREGEIQTVQAICDQIAVSLERARAQRDLRRSEQRFRTIVETAQEGIWAVDARGNTLVVNARMAALLGTTQVAMSGRPLQDYCFPEDLEELAERMSANKAGHTEEFEFRFRREDGSALHVLAATAPLRDGDGAIIGGLAGFLDLSERKKAEERQHVLMNELAHRGKNLLAVIQSIAGRSLTGARTLDEGRAAFTGRLQALSNTYSHLIDESFEGAPLGDIIESELASFGGRVHRSGPNLMLTAKMAQTFALIIHELATNAAKYGALSVAAGQIHVSWAVQEARGERRFTFDWREEGGPPAKPPIHQGFGTILVSRVAGMEMECTPQVNYGQAGFRYHLDAALSAVGQVTDESPVRQRLRSEVLLAFYDAWASLRGLHGRMPVLKQLKRDSFATAGALTVAEIGGNGDAHLVEVGHALTERMGRLLDPKDLQNPNPDGIRESYERCAKHGRPCYEHLRFDFGDGEPVTFERLLLPFTRGGKRITHVAGLVVFSGKSDGGNDGKRAAMNYAGAD